MEHDPVRGRIYSVPSRLIGHQVEVRQHPDDIEVLFAGQVIETLPRCATRRPPDRLPARDLVAGAQAGRLRRYRFREDLFPSLVFRRAYDALRASRGDRADVEYVRILHLAASTMEATSRRLTELLASGEPFDYAAVKASG